MSPWAEHTFSSWAAENLRCLLGKVGYILDTLDLGNRWIANVLSIGGCWQSHLLDSPNVQKLVEKQGERSLGSRPQP